MAPERYSIYTYKHGIARSIVRLNRIMYCKMFVWRGDRYVVPIHVRSVSLCHLKWLCACWCIMSLLLFHLFTSSPQKIKQLTIFRRWPFCSYITPPTEGVGWVSPTMCQNSKIAALSKWSIAFLSKMSYKLTFKVFKCAVWLFHYVFFEFNKCHITMFLFLKHDNNPQIPNNVIDLIKLKNKCSQF